MPRLERNGGGKRVTYKIIETRPIAPALGAEIGGVDLSRPLGDDVIAAAQARHEHEHDGSHSGARD